MIYDSGDIAGGLKRQDSRRRDGRQISAISLFFSLSLSLFNNLSHGIPSAESWSDRLRVPQFIKDRLDANATGILGEENGEARTKRGNLKSGEAGKRHVVIRSKYRRYMNLNWIFGLLHASNMSNDIIMYTPCRLEEMLGWLTCRIAPSQRFPGVLPKPKPRSSRLHGVGPPINHIASTQHYWSHFFKV